MVNFSQGESIVLEVSFTDENGTPIDLVTIAPTSLRAYFIIKDCVAAKFTDPLLEVLTGYGDITIVNAYTLQFNVTASISKTLPVGELTVNVGYKNVNGDFEVSKSAVAVVNKGYVLKDEIYN